MFDHFGPISLKPGYGSGVPAHPHCGFEAITYLLDGEVEHCDSWGGRAIINTGDTGTVTNTMLAGSIVNSKLTNDSVTVGSTEIDLGATATTIAGMTKMTLLNSADNCLTITGGDSAATNAAVSISGHLEATTKSFNIPHPLYDKKRLV